MSTGKSIQMSIKLLVDVDVDDVVFANIIDDDDELPKVC